MRARRLIWLPLVVLLALTPAWSWPVAGTTAPNQAAPSLSVESVVRDLATIWAVDFALDGRIFLTERSGRIRTARDGVLEPDPWLTIDGVVEGGESGLMGLALDPEFAANGYVYTAYTYATAGEASRIGWSA